jgi:purine-binding chemotaxis protein CheW
MVNEATAAVRPQPDRAAPTTGAPARRPSWLLCRSGTLLCAIPLEHVIETLRVLPIEAVAGAPRYVRGLSVIRGSAVPVIDTGLLVGDQPTSPERLVTIRTGSRTIALAVEAVVGISVIGEATVSALPPLLRDAASEAVAAIGTLDAELLIFLRATRMVPPDVLDRLIADGTSA